MNRILVFLLIVSSVLFAVDKTNSTNDRINKQIEKEIEKEKRYSIEKVFYNHDNYDFKGSEVNLESLKSLPEIELDDLDMDSVYD